QPVFNLGGEKTDLEQLWSQLPSPQSAVSVEVQEGAESWADAINTDGTRSPWLVTRLFGAGRVFYVSSDESWRWRYKVADRFHARFWNQLVAVSMQPPYAASDEYVAIGTDRIEYVPGESAVIRARLQDTNGKPVGDATVDALVIADNEIVATVPMSIDDPARGTYLGTTEKLAAGSYEVRIRASGFDAGALQASSPIWVRTRDNVEMNRVSLNRNALTEIANAGGGVYLHESSASDILDSLRPLSSGAIVESDVLVWQSFYWFWAVIGVLGLEWLLRKKAGLV
ncbi:MAG: VWA domain-containing protein, partial [Rubripirellula sp.]